MSEALFQQLREALEYLAMPADAQLRHVAELGVAPDELALEFDDVAPARRTLIAEGRLSDEQGDAVGAVQRQLKRMSSSGSSRWTPDAVRAGEDWREVRRLANSALLMLR